MQRKNLPKNNRPPLRNGECMIPEQHQFKCNTCGKIIDMRVLAQVAAHGIYNEETGKYECKEPGDVEYKGSRQVGDSVEWTKDKKPNHLN
jgi:hypothetical protein